ncbi:MAG: hypothetical protein CVT59_02595 [Actinobacteria bacterium HGW-Actinobacteria-1]|nr:MAG: hypothetical protein CVT59_02595 [Actinobacteria bacterium HGW-Actinobacteria-1]
MDERDRRHKREFEPPPWEQEAFERFEKDRHEREEEARLEAALAAAKAASLQPEREPEPAEAEVEQEAAPKIVVGEIAAEQEQARPAGGVGSAELEAMLLGLRHEEPPAAKNYTTVANVVSALMVVGGLGFVIWAAVLFAKVGADQGPTPTLASLLLMVWGFLLMGGAVLLFRKYNL